MILNIFFIFIIFCHKIDLVKNVYVVNVVENPIKLTQFWRSTGFSPPKENVTEFLLSQDVKMNLALIGALPNKAIKEVRIHWLLDMLKIKYINKTSILYDYSQLDILMDWIHKQGLVPNFELMGNPSNYFNGNDPKSLQYWEGTIYQIVLRYADRYGRNYITQWRFETWNEPDLKMYNTMNFTWDSYRMYYLSSLQALERASTVLKIPKLKLGGPAGLFKNPKNHIICWGSLYEFNKSNQIDPSFLSYHMKGEEIARNIINRSISLIEDIHSKFPSLKSLPIANTEADIMTGWSKSREWRTDVRYAAMALSVIMDHLSEFISRRKINIEVLSNDNAFLNYHPHYFSQRTLLTRFQMNNTNPPHTQFFSKPIYSAMALMSFFLDNLQEAPKISKKFLTGNSSYFEYKSKSQTPIKTNRETASLSIYHSDTNLFNNTITINETEYHQNFSQTKYVVYLIDNNLTNPYAVWKKAGSPVFPDIGLRNKMRKTEGVHRIVPPTVFVNNKMNVIVNTSIPCILLIHTCDKNNNSPGPVSNMQIFNVTKDEILIIWKDHDVGTRCIKTYEVEFKKEETGNEEPSIFQRVNNQDSIFLYFQHVAISQAGSPKKDNKELTRGQYRVRAVDYWDRTGPYSPIMTYP